MCYLFFVMCREAAQFKRGVLCGGGEASTRWNGKGVEGIPTCQCDIYGMRECLDMEEHGASTCGLVVVWMSQHEWGLMELTGCPLVEVQ